jgi:hypothetical protein
LRHDVPVAPHATVADIGGFLEAAENRNAAIAEGYDLFGRDGGIKRIENGIVAVEILGRCCAAFEPWAGRKLAILAIACRRAARNPDFDMIGW